MSCLAFGARSGQKRGREWEWDLCGLLVNGALRAVIELGAVGLEGGTGGGESGRSVG